MINWDDRIRHSILVDSQADLLIFGMERKANLGVVEIQPSAMYL
jgi:hypothetical protein